MSRPLRVAFAVVVAFAPHLVQAAGTPGQVCAGAKLKAAGKTAGRSFACHAKAARRGGFVEGPCIDAAATKLIGDFSRAEARGGCVSPGDATIVRDALLSRVGLLANALRPDVTANHCAALKLKAAGKKAKTKLVCHGKTIRNGLAVDPACLAKAEARFNADFAKAEARQPCLTMNDAAAVENDVDVLVSEVLALVPSATTSTTPGSTITTSTSTLAPGTTTTTTGVPICGNGIREGNEQCDGTDVHPECGEAGRSGCFPAGDPNECDCCTQPAEIGVIIPGGPNLCCSGGSGGPIGPSHYVCEGTCSSTPFPTCGGSCQIGTFCAPLMIGSTQACGCAPTGPCDTTCSGAACPSGQACRFDTNTATCGCDVP